MQRYIEQIIEDLKAAQKNAPPEPDFGDTYEELAKTMLEIEKAEKIPSKQKFGVSYEELPASNKLTDIQINKLLPALIETMNIHGIYIDFPKGVPQKLQYELIRDEFLEGFNSMSGWHIDFCNGWCPDCPIFDYCEIWKETWTLEEIKEERNKKNYN